VKYARRRTRRGRSSKARLRRRVGILTLLVACLGVLGLAAFRIASSHFSPSNSRSEWIRGDASSSLARFATQTALGLAPSRGRGVVYPYSVVPGGVESPADLKQASDGDRTVAKHYAGFDYRRARVIEVREPKLVYVSYRMHDRIYWTSKRIRLHRGERLISDGKMTARERCGNQVSDSAQKAVSREEPPAEKFEQPFLADGGTATQTPPAEFASVLRNAPQFDGAGPGGPPVSSTYLFGPGGSSGFPPVFPPPIPVNAGACDTIFSGPGSAPGSVEHNCPKHPGPGQGPTPPPPSTVPEPGTIFLISSGAVGIYLRYRKAGK
jgi:PEP-CTERM motif-containing protein